MPCCHWVLIAWIWLGYIHCTSKCLLFHDRVKCTVVTPKFNVVWAWHKVFHNLPCLRLGLFPVGIQIHQIIPSTLFSFTIHWYFSSCLKVFHPKNRDDICSYTSYYNMSGMKPLCAAHYIWAFWSSKFIVIHLSVCLTLYSMHHNGSERRNSWIY